METFSLLKYWRGSGSAANVRTAAANPASSSDVRATTLATSVLRPAMESDEEEDEGSFFDLELAVQNAPGDEADSTSGESGDEAEEEAGELNFTVSSSSSSSSSASSDPSTSLSPSDDLFFKGQLLPLEPSSILITASSDSDHKISQFPVSLLKSATKLRVFMLGLKKPKSIQADPNAAATTTTTSPKQHQNQNQNNKFFIKFKVEGVPIVSLFTRESSGSKKSIVKSPKSEEEAVVTAEEKKFSKETVQKYINKIKPLYVRVSKRYGEKLRFSGQLTADVAAADVTGGDEAVGEPEPTPAPALALAAPAAATTAKVKIPAGLRVVRKRLGKSKSASLAVVAAVASPPVAQQRRDDSLLQQQDGIQSAIAHCKRSLNAATCKGSQSSPLARSKSDPTEDRGEKRNGDGDD